MSLISLFPLFIYYGIYVLPNFLRLGLQKLLRWYGAQIIWDDDLVRDLADFFNLTRDETGALSKVGEKVFHMMWNALEPKTDEEIVKFYEVSPFNVFSLPYWHAR
jgi:hypothetical protein